MLFSPDIEFQSLVKHSMFDDKYRYRRNVQSFDEVYLKFLLRIYID